MTSSINTRRETAWLNPIYIHNDVKGRDTWKWSVIKEERKNPPPSFFFFTVYFRSILIRSICCLLHSTLFSLTNERKKRKRTSLNGIDATSLHTQRWSDDLLSWRIFLFFQLLQWIKFSYIPKEDCFFCPHCTYCASAASNSRRQNFFHYYFNWFVVFLERKQKCFCCCNLSIGESFW